VENDHSTVKDHASLELDVIHVLKHTHHVDHLLQVIGIIDVYLRHVLACLDY
jgi:hypothetical protein